MGLGGVAIAVLPSMIYPKQPFSDGLWGGGIHNYLRISSIELLISFELAKQCLAFQNTRNRITVSMVVRTCLCASSINLEMCSKRAS